MKGSVRQGEVDAELNTAITECMKIDQSDMVVLLARWRQKDWIAIPWANRKEKPFKTIK